MIRVSLTLNEPLPRNCTTCKHTIDMDWFIACQYTKKDVENAECEKSRHKDCPMDRVPKETV